MIKVMSVADGMFNYITIELNLIKSTRRTICHGGLVNKQ